MDYSIPAKPTIYAQTRFRSRLEARWAALFDILKWPYIYEPLDLGVWSPDFIILGKTTIFVEVKPILTFDLEVARKMEQGIGAWLGIPGPIREEPAEPLLLGVSPMPYDAGCLGTLTALGWGAEWKTHPMELGCVGPLCWNWDEALVGRRSESRPTGLYGLDYGTAQKDRITGQQTGRTDWDACIEDARDSEWSAWTRLWAQAGTITQWKPQ